MSYEQIMPFARRGWELCPGAGPVLATAVHAGHQMAEDLLPHLKVSADTRRREEDPMTGIWASVGDHAFRCYVSRFQVDLNRAREKAIYLEPDDAWGIDVWNEQPSQQRIEQILEEWDEFYAMMRMWIEAMIAQHGKVLLLDIHSYNHRRGGPFAHAGKQEDNPDIDLGVTTTDSGRFGAVLDRLHEELTSKPVVDRELDVRRNVRYPDGGHWPEWVFANYGEDVATITLEYKKFYMDEWTGNSFLPVVEGLRHNLSLAVDAAKKELSSC